MVRLGGELDATAEDAVTGAVDGAQADIDARGGDLVLVDLNATARLGTLSVGILLRTQEATGKISVDFAVVVPPGSAAVDELAAPGAAGPCTGCPPAPGAHSWCLGHRAPTRCQIGRG